MYKKQNFGNKKLCFKLFFTNRCSCLLRYSLIIKSEEKCFYTCHFYTWFPWKLKRVLLIYFFTNINDSFDSYWFLKFTNYRNSELFGISIFKSTSRLLFQKQLKRIKNCQIYWKLWNRKICDKFWVIVIWWLVLTLKLH